MPGTTVGIKLRDAKDDGPARLCISGLQFECRECHAVVDVHMADFLVPEKWMGSVTHVCTHWGDKAALQKGKQPWDDISQFCKLLTEMSTRLKSHNLEIPLDIRIVG